MGNEKIAEEILSRLLCNPVVRKIFEDDITEALDAKDLSHKKVVEGLQDRIKELEDLMRPRIAFRVDFPAHMQFSREQKSVVVGMMEAYEAQIFKLSSLTDELAGALKRIRSFVTKEVNSGAAPWYVEECAKRRYLLDEALTKYTSWKGGKK